ncbi:Hypothetical_protein [Hexamita inflata]|nr:Hypothetical protein HINF_LOCUS50098 [Hexamita inflata]
MKPFQTLDERVLMVLSVLTRRLLHTQTYMHHSLPLLDRTSRFLQTIWYHYVKNHRHAVVARWRHSCAPAPGVSITHINILETNIAVKPEREFQLYFQTLTQHQQMGKRQLHYKILLIY